MSGARSVFAVDRGIWDDCDFAPEPFSEREAWLWLVSAAAWKDTRARGNAGAVDLKRGEFSFSVRFLAEKWQWSKDRAFRFLHRLEKRDMIADTSRDSSQIYSVNKYNHFQVVGIPKRDSDETLTATAPRQHRDKEETGKQDNKEQETKQSSAPPTAAPPKPRATQGTRWPITQEVPKDWFAPIAEKFRSLGRAPPDFPMEAVKFANYWGAKSGKDATKIDWHKTFENWCLNARTDQRSSFSKPGFDDLREGARRAVGLDGRRGQGVEAAPDNLLRLAGVAGHK